MNGTPSPGTAFAGCSLSLPSGLDRDSGLAQQYMNDQQGRTFLFVPMLGAREIYSDNVTLAPRGKESPDFVTELMPGFTVCQQAPRVTTQFHYQLDGLYYAEHQNRNAIFNEFSGQTHAEVLPGHLFFDARTDYGLAVINPAQPYSLDRVLDIGNRTSVWTFDLSPYWVQSLGPLGITTTRYSYDRALYTDPAIAPFYSNSVSFNLVNPPHNGAWSWDANYQSSELKRQGPYYRTNFMDSASLQLGYQATEEWQVLGQGGVEDNYLPDGTTRRLDSPFWNAGFRWSDQITSLEVRYGHRFFGKSIFAKLEHQGKDLTVAVSYTEAPEVSSLYDLGTGLYAASGLPASQGGPTLQPGQQLLPLTSLNDNRVYLGKSLVGSISYNTGRSTIHVDGYREQQTYLQASTVFAYREQETTGADAYWRWQWMPRLAVIPRFAWEKAQYNTGQVSYISAEYLSLAYLLSPTAQAGVTIRHQQSISSSPSSSYREDAIIFEVIKIF